MELRLPLSLVNTIRRAYSRCLTQPCGNTSSQYSTVTQRDHLRYTSLAPPSFPHSLSSSSLYFPHSWILMSAATTNHIHLIRQLSTSSQKSELTNEQPDGEKEAKENIYTIPNYLTVGRFFISPYLGYMVLQEQFTIACSLFIVTGLTDMLDGYIARNWKGQSSILGSVIDPLADKFLVTILCLSLTTVHLIPLWLTTIILSRDVYLVFSGFRVRWVTLPPPKTFKRYFDFSHPTASVQPSLISKVNTNVQLLLLTATCAAPVFNYVDHPGLQMLWGVTALTTGWSFYDYVTKAPYTVLRKR